MGFDIVAFYNNLDPFWQIAIPAGVFLYIIIVVTGTSRGRAAAIRQRPSGTDIRYANKKPGQDGHSTFNTMPVVVTSETIAQELGWTLERYKKHQANEKAQLINTVPEFGSELHPEEIILRKISFQNVLERYHIWDIVLTDKRILYKFEEKKRSMAVAGRLGATTIKWVASHWYSDIVDVNTQWSGDLGSHIEGGGGSVSGWVWNGMGSIQGQQKGVTTVQHHINCGITIKEQNGDWQRLPDLAAWDEEGLKALQDFVGMLDKLVDMAWQGRRYEASAPSAIASTQNQPPVKATPVAGNTLSELERYAAMREKGLLTEEEYNQQKKKLLG